MKSGLFLICAAFCGQFLASVVTTTIKIKNNSKVRRAREITNVAQHDYQLDQLAFRLDQPDSLNYGFTEITDNELDHEKFMIPKTLKPDDRILVRGNMTSDRTWITVSLVMHNGTMDSPDFDNVACRMRVKFPTAQSRDNDVTIHAVVEGEHQRPKSAEIDVTDAFAGTSVFQIFFVILESDNISIRLHDSDSAQNCELHEKHDLSDIRYLTLGGHIDTVDEISFELA